MARSLITVVLFAVALAACGREADRARPEPAASAVDAPLADTSALAETDTAEARLPALEADPAKARALDVALDTLEAFVQVLERVKGPINAWNQAAEAARLLRYLEQNQAAFALDEPEEDAARRYPRQIARLRRLEERREAELKRIGEDPVATQVLVEEMAKAEAASR